MAECRTTMANCHTLEGEQEPIPEDPTELIEVSPGYFISALSIKDSNLGMTPEDYEAF